MDALRDRRPRRRPHAFSGMRSVPSEGWAKSRIADQQAVSACVLACIEQAEAMAQTSIESVVAGIGGLTVRGANSRGKWDLGRPREVTQKDVNRAMERAMRVQLQEDRMILEVLPQDFVVDDHPGFHDPREMLGSTLEANAHLVTASAQEHSNLVERSTARIFRSMKPYMKPSRRVTRACCRRTAAKASR